MKTPAIISSLTVVGSLAYAAGSHGTAGKQSPVMPSGAQAHAMQERMPNDAMSTTSVPCPPPVQWLSTTPRFFDPCDTALYPEIGVQKLEAADVNGDGLAESIALSGNSGELLVTNDGGTHSSQNPTKLLRLCTTADGGDTRLESQVVFTLDTQAAGNAIRNRFPGVSGVMSNAQGIGTGWLDCDGDGDLDLVLYLNGYLPNGTRQIWFENIGYEKPIPPLAADLNGDGWVNGLDLGLLLGAWGTNS
jgi:hypothetical protein